MVSNLNTLRPEPCVEGYALLDQYDRFPQVCTGVMMHGYCLVKKLCAELEDFMKMQNFTSIEDFIGASLGYFTTHMGLVQRQQEAIQQRKASRKGLQSYKDWTGDGFVKRV